MRNCGELGVFLPKQREVAIFQFLKYEIFLVNKNGAIGARMYRDFPEPRIPEVGSEDKEWLKLKLKEWLKSSIFGSLPEPLQKFTGKGFWTGPGAWGVSCSLGFTSHWQAPSHLVPSQVAPPVAPSPVECSPEVAAPIEKNEGLMKGWQFYHGNAGRGQRGKLTLALVGICQILATVSNLRW